MKKYISIFLAAVMCLFCLTACMESTRIIGTWQTEDGSTTMTFDKDGTGSVKVGSTISLTSDISYKVEGTTLTITTTVSLLGFSTSTDESYEISFEKSNLVLSKKNSDGTLSTAMTLKKK